jgi:predicted RNA binding protein YcfA (HicA-like mRNA interferase family)
MREVNSTKSMSFSFKRLIRGFTKEPDAGSHRERPLPKYDGFVISGHPGENRVPRIVEVLENTGFMFSPE